jgi:hypothetical protein
MESQSMKKHLPLFLSILLIPLFLLPSADSKLEKNLIVEQGQVYEENIVSFGGEIKISGEIKESVVLIGGTLTLKGKVQKDVICIGAEVNIAAKAVIEGDLILIGGKLNRDRDSVINGEYFFFKFDLKKIENSIMPILSDSQTLTFFKTLKIIFWFLITLIVFAVIPRKIAAAEEIFTQNGFKIGLTGLVAIFTFIFLLMICIMLSFVIIGLPMLIVLILLYFGVFIFGRTVLFYFLGQKLSGALNIKKVTPAVFILFGVMIYALVKFLPVLGPMLVLLMNVLEIGVGVTYLLRKRLSLKH